MFRRPFLGAAVAVTLAAAALAFWKWRIINPATGPLAFSFQNADFFIEIYPMSHRAAQWLLAGVMPLWNPFQFCGHPFLATAQTGILYPLNFFYLLLPTEKAIEATIVLHIFVAGVFMYLYARTIRLSPAAGIAAASIFMFSGFLISEATWYTAALAAAVWLPLAFLAIERILVQPAFSWAALLGIAVTMPLLSGYLQTWLYSLYAIGAYVVVGIVALAVRRTPPGRLTRIGALVAAAGLLAAGLSAVQLLPSWELQGLGPRRPGALSLHEILTLNFFRPATPRALLSAVTNSVAPFADQIYLGIPALILSPLSLFAARGRLRVAFLVCLALFSFAVALTVYSPVLHLYLMLPAATWFRMPQRILFLYAFAGAVLSGIGFDVIAQMGGRKPDARRVGAVVIATVIGLAWWLSLDIPQHSRAYFSLGLILLWGAVLVRSVMVRRGLVLLLLGLIGWDLFHAQPNRGQHPYHAPRVFDAQADVFEFIRQHQGLDRTYIHMLWYGPEVMPKQGTLRGIYSITDYETLTLSRYQKFFDVLQGRYPATDPSPFTGSLYLLPSTANFRLLALMSVRYIVVPRRDTGFRQALEGAWRLVPGRGDFVAYENGDVLPRAYVAHQATVVNGEDEALDSLRNLSFDAWKAVVVEADGAANLPSLPPSRAAITPARIVSYRPTQVIVETNDSESGYLVLTDTFYPGWRATVDGRSQPIYRANYLFRAMPVPAGHHTVTFVYDPLSFKIGLALTLCTLCVLGVGGARTVVAICSRRRGAAAGQ